jgi:hypothetical protein
MIKDLKSKYYPKIFLDWLRKTVKNLNQNSRFVGLHSNRELPEYETRTLALHKPVRLGTYWLAEWVFSYATLDRAVRFNDRRNQEPEHFATFTQKYYDPAIRENWISKRMFQQSILLFSLISDDLCNANDYGNWAQAVSSPVYASTQYHTDFHYGWKLFPLYTVLKTTICLCIYAAFRDTDQRGSWNQEVQLKICWLVGITPDFLWV